MSSKIFDLAFRRHIALSSICECVPRRTCRVLNIRAEAGGYFFRTR